MAFKANAVRRHHIPQQRHRVTNSAAYDAALRQRGSLTVWFTDAAIAAWKAEPRTTRGGQSRYSALAIATALTLRAAFRLALRQAEGLIGSIIALLGLDLAVPDHATLSRRAESLDVVRPRPGSGPVHLLVDSTGLKLCGSGDWLLEKQPCGPIPGRSSLVAACVSDGVYGEVMSRHPEASVIVPPRSSAVPNDTAQTAPTMRDQYLQTIAERGRVVWQKAAGYTWRARVEADISRFKRVIGDGLLSRIDRRRATEVEIAVNALNRMLELGRPEYVRLR